MDLNYRPRSRALEVLLYSAETFSAPFSILTFLRRFSSDGTLLDKRSEQLNEAVANKLLSEEDYQRERRRNHMNVMLGGLSGFVAGLSIIGYAAYTKEDSLFFGAILTNVASIAYEAGRGVYGVLRNYRRSRKTRK